MHMNRHELAGIAVGLESKGGVGNRLGEIDLPENIPGFAAVSLSVQRDAFFERRHEMVLCFAPET
jgi:hypothetical protein